MERSDDDRSRTERSDSVSSVKERLVSAYQGADELNRDKLSFVECLSK